MSPPVAPPRDICATRPGLVSLLISEQLGLSVERALELIHFGAVYHNRTRLIGDKLARTGDYVRTHLNPRRFPVSMVRWKQRIIAESEEYLVVDKPSGVPVHATCDNFVENVAYQMERALETRLGIVHRLDIGTQGLLVLAKTASFTSRFNLLSRNREVTKYYRALVAESIKLGEVFHFMRPGNRAPREVKSDFHEGWLKCHLRVESLCSKPSGYFEATLQLFTGRNHQIRSQLAALGAPIVGDALYGSRYSAPAGDGEGEVFALQASFLKFQSNNGVEAYSLPSRW